jgi:hypothetical protein
LVAATALGPTEEIATTRPANPTPAIATFCLFMEKGTRFARKNTPVAECIGSADTTFSVQLFRGN